MRSSDVHAALLDVGGAVIALVILMALLGLWIDLKRREARRRASAPRPGGVTA